MDEFKQLGKYLRKKQDETKQNTRRVSENFPLVERKIDDVVYNRSFEMSFPLSDHPHTVSLDLHFKSPENCFQCNPGYAEPGDYHCVATCPSFGPADGNAYPGIYDTLEQNVGGFQIEPTGGIIVPKDGYYTIRFLNDVAGVPIASAAAIIASTRHNGIVISQATYLATAFITVDLFGLCILCRKGDVLGGWLAAGGIAFYTPSDFCGLFGTSKTYITLVGLA